MSRRKNKPLRNGRNPTTRFARLDHRLLKSAAYRSLSLAARALLVELTMMENGENNGSLYLSIDDASDRLGTADPRVAMGAFEELEARGFIAMTKDSSFSIKASSKSRARCWRLTWQASDGKGPTNDWDLGWETRQPAAGTKERKRMEKGLRALKRYRKEFDQNRLPVEDSTTLDPLREHDRPVAVENFTTGLTENCDNSSSAIVVDSSPHTAVTMPHRENAGEPAGAGPPNSAATAGDMTKPAGVWRECEDRTCKKGFLIDRRDQLKHDRYFCSETCRHRALGEPSEETDTLNDDPDEFFRARLATFWRQSDRASQSALAHCVGITPTELAGAVRNAAHIAPPKRVAILCELRRAAA